MAAEIRVDTITSRSGINTLSFIGDGFAFLTNVGIGTTITTNPVDASNTQKLAVGVVTANQVYSSTVNVGTGVTLYGSTGIVSASGGFVGNVTGTASTATAAGTAFGLSGNPSVLVSGIGINTTSASQQFQVGSGTSIVVIDSSGDLGIGTVSVPSRFYVQGNAAGNIVSIGNTNATTTLDFTRGNNFTLTLTGNITIANPTGVTTGQSGVILIQEDGTGGYTCAWGTSWDFASSTAPTLTTTANALNALPYFARSTTSIVVGSVIAGIGTL